MTRATSTVAETRPEGPAPQPGPGRRARLVGVLMIPLAMLGTAVLVTQQSYSSFSSATSTGISSWSTGSVTLTNDLPSSALFSLTGLKPGSLGVRCVTVTSTGSLPANVRLYGTGYASTAGLAANLKVVITAGTGGSAATCSGFTPLATGASVFDSTLSAFSASSSYAGGLPVWTTAGVTTGSETRTFQISYSLDLATPNTAQNGTASIAFTWEAENV